MLRPFRVTNVKDFMVWAGNDWVTRQLLRWETVTSEEEALAYINDVCIPHPWCRSICIHDRSVGLVSVFPHSGYHRERAEMGSGLAVKYWGRGVAAQAVKMAVSQAFLDIPGLVRLQAFADIHNKASQRTLEKVGFKLEVCSGNLHVSRALGGIAFLIAFSPLISLFLLLHFDSYFLMFCFEERL